MKIIINFLSLLICLSLTSCDGRNHKDKIDFGNISDKGKVDHSDASDTRKIDYSDANYKEQIQARLDDANPTGAKGICFRIDGLIYPYISTYTSPTEIELENVNYVDAKRNFKLNQVLHVFAQIGFLSEEPMEDDKGQPIHEYDLTDLGNAHYYYYDGFNDGFCFGQAKVIRLSQPQGASGPETESYEGFKTKYIFFEYEINNVPDWVIENKMLLSQVYTENKMHLSQPPESLLQLLDKKPVEYHVMFERYTKSKNEKNREWHIPQGNVVAGSPFLKLEKGWLD